MQTILDLLDEFCAVSLARGRSPNTVRAYRSDLRATAAALPGPVATLARRELEAYLDGLAEQLSPGARNRRRAALAVFFRWCQQQEIRADNPVDLIDAVTEDRALPRPVPPADRALVEHAIAQAPQPARLALTILRETGIRASEALGLDVADVNLTPGAEVLRLRGTKANTDRVVVLHPDATPRTLTGIRRHLRELGAEARPHRPLFLSNRKLRLDYDTLRYHWAQACATVGLVAEGGEPRYTLHQLRHTRATELLASGVPEPLVQRALGHRDPRSTQRYAQLDDEELRKELSRRRS